MDSKDTNQWTRPDSTFVCLGVGFGIELELNLELMIGQNRIIGRIF